MREIERRYWHLAQTVTCVLHEDWYSDLDEDDDASAWDVTERYLVGEASTERLIGLRDEILPFMEEHPDTEVRWKLLQPAGGFRSHAEFDEWLLMLHRRVLQALAGDHSQPMADPHPTA